MLRKELVMFSSDLLIYTRKRSQSPAKSKTLRRRHPSAQGIPSQRFTPRRAVPKLDTDAISNMYFLVLRFARVCGGFYPDNSPCKQHRAAKYRNNGDSQRHP